jgi:hypothetical protein
MLKSLFVIGLAACSGTSSTEDSLTPTCQDAMTHSDLAWIQTNIFTKSCAFSGCHVGTAPNAGHLDLEAGTSYANLVGANAMTQPGWKRVVAGDPDSSFLMVALGHAAGPMPADGYMPLSSPALCTEKLDAIARWITAGAAQ